MSKPDPDRSQTTTTVTTTARVLSENGSGAPLEIRGSVGKLVGLAFLSLFMTASSASTALYVLTAESSDFKTVIWVGVGAFGTLFFGFATIVAVKRTFTHRGAVITLSDEGIRDIRLSKDTVHWDEIERVSTWGGLGSTFVILELTAAAWDRLAPNRMTRLSRGANRALGADGLAVAAQGTQMSFDQLFAEITVRAEAARRP